MIRRDPHRGVCYIQCDFCKWERGPVSETFEEAVSGASSEGFQFIEQDFVSPTNHRMKRKRWLCPGCAVEALKIKGKSPDK